MKVWWCQQHEHPSVKRCTETDGTCRMVEMQLVPADARMEWWCAKENVGGDVDRAWLCEQGAKDHDRQHCGFVWIVPVPDPTKEEPPKDPWDYDP